MQTIEKIIKSAIPPLNTSVLWLDESLKRPVLKSFNNGKWSTVSDETDDITLENGDGENSAVQKGSNGVAFGDNSILFGTSTTNAKDRGITKESTDEEIVTEWQNSDPESDKFALAKGDGSFVEGNNCLALGKNSHAEGGFTIANGFASHAEGSYTKAMSTNGCSHAEGYNTEATGDCSHAEGSTTKATEVQAHAEGYSTTASGSRSHAEGEGTTASGSDSHAEGKNTTAKASKSHAEGEGSYANGSISHAEGWGTKTSNKAEHAEGSYNKSTNGGSAERSTRHSVGIGTGDDARKNAFEIMQNGDTYLYGVGGYDGTNPGAATPINQLIGQGGGSTLQVTGTFNSGDSEFTCTSGHSLNDVKAALLAGTPVIVDVVVDPDGDNLRYVTTDISVFYDSGIWYAYSHTFALGTIDNWVVQS